MLEISIDTSELWDEEHEKFIPVEKTKLQLEHSLISISKWESKWHKAFMAYDYRTNEELLDYIKCMTITKHVDDTVYYSLNNEHFDIINNYIDNPMTATKFSGTKRSGTSEGFITSELIYYWMISLHIPVEFQKWHLNRLLTLIQVCNLKNQPAKKMSQSELIRRQAEINEMRRKKYNTKG